LWPDFTPDEFDRALAWFVETDRRFGGVSQKVSDWAKGAIFAQVWLRCGLDQTLGSGQVTGLRAALDVQAPEQAPEVNLDGVLADL